MSWIPSKDEIEKEVNNYNDLGFFKKSKNGLLLFVVFVSAISILVSIFLGPAIGISPLSAALYLLFVPFIYFNHRWAMVVFAILYIGDKVVFIAAGSPPVSQIIFGTLVAVLSYQSFCVATQLKKNTKTKAIFETE